MEVYRIFVTKLGNRACLRRVLLRCVLQLDRVPLRNNHIIASQENQHRVPKTDVIVMMQLVLLDRYAINARAISAAEISNDELIASAGDDAVLS